VSVGSFTCPAYPGVVYTVAERDPGLSYVLQDISCSGGEAEIDVQGRSVKISVGTNEGAICFFTNAGPGQITIQKLLSSGDVSQTFTFDSPCGEKVINGVGSFTCPADPGVVHVTDEDDKAEATCPASALVKPNGGSSCHLRRDLRDTRPTSHPGEVTNVATATVGRVKSRGDPRP
jgi:hypothetical protein